MSEWRPEGWENPELAVERCMANFAAASGVGAIPDNVWVLKRQTVCFEAGADAMLAALRPLVNEDPCGCCGGHHPPIIPDEE